MIETRLYPTILPRVISTGGGLLLNLTHHEYHVAPIESIKVIVVALATKRGEQGFHTGSRVNGLHGETNCPTAEDNLRNGIQDLVSMGHGKGGIQMCGVGEDVTRLDNY
ncbi:hypothetical protein J6590_033131 [Homalodisca vitripennis]|nr:hypothetical protein J6590_033131 [Homalodisca vitripennis]